MYYEISPDKVGELGIIVNGHAPFGNITTIAASGKWDVICNGDMCNFSPTVQPYWEKQLQKIKAAGWDNCLAYPSGKYVKVVVGPYPSNNDAYNVSNSIKRKGIGCFALAGKYI